MKSLLQHFAIDWSLRKKGLLLVCVPLVFQIILTALLGFLYTQAEAQASKEAQARQLMIRAHRVVFDILEAGEMLVIYAAMPIDPVYHQWLAKKEQLMNDSESVKELAVEQRSSSVVYERLVNLTNVGIRILDDCFRRTKNRSAKNLYDTMPDVKDFIRTFNNEFEFVLTHDLNSQLLGALSEEATRKLIAGALYASVVIDILIAIVLSLFFASSIEQRLNVITDNTRKMRERKPLNPAVKGGDEIAALDHEFHNLSGELRESERLRSEFISMVSHDMKTPLMSVELSLSHVKSELPEDVQLALAAELQSINSNMRRVMALIRDVLDLERGASGKLSLEIEEVDVDELFNRVKSSLKVLAAQKGVGIETDSHEETVFADKRRLDQVLVNIASNAIKFCPGGSTIRLSATKTGGEVELRVLDNGPGIAEADRQNVFGRFVQLPNDSSASASGAGLKVASVDPPKELPDAGSGLGLAICKTIIESHGGQIGYEPNPGGGSQFWIKLQSAES